MEEEFSARADMPDTNQLQIIITKTKKPMLKTTASHFSAPQPLSFIEQVTQNFLGEFIILKPFSAAAHVEHVLSVANQRLYLLIVLKSQGLSCDALHVIFTAIVLSVVTYALLSFAGQLSKGDKASLDSLFRKAFRRGFSCQTFSIDEFTLAADKKYILSDV